MWSQSFEELIINDKEQRSRSRSRWESNGVKMERWKGGCDMCLCNTAQRRRLSCDIITVARYDSYSLLLPRQSVTRALSQPARPVIVVKRDRGDPFARRPATDDRRRNPTHIIFDWLFGLIVEGKRGANEVTRTNGEREMRNDNFD